MRKGVLFGILIGLSFLAGCSSGVVRSGPERVNMYKHSFNMDFRQVADDWDSIWLLDHQCRLTPWITR